MLLLFFYVKFAVMDVIRLTDAVTKTRACNVLALVLNKFFHTLVTSCLNIKQKLD